MTDPPAQKVFVDKFLCWDRVEARLENLPHIKELFPHRKLNECSDRAPYYCHWLAWRLGTWDSEEVFQYLNELINTCKNLHGWGQNKVADKITSCEFADFWSFLWELQVAAYFSSKGKEVEWTQNGPDLQIKFEDQTFWVECYVYRKSFHIEEWIGEIFLKIDPNIRVGHTPCTGHSLPQNQELEGFLNNLFLPYLEDSFLEGKRTEARTTQPVSLPVPNGSTNFKVWLEGDGEYTPGIFPSQTGPPKGYLDHVLKEAINNKKGSNKINDHHPNLLAVNFLLGEDFQLATNRSNDLNEKPVIEFPHSIDGILIGICGIDSALGNDNFTIRFNDSAQSNHPLHER